MENTEKENKKENDSGYMMHGAKKRNQLKTGVFLSYFNMGINILISLLYTPVMLRLLGQSQYGVYQTAASVISYLSLLSLGFGSSYMRFYARYKSRGDEEGMKKLNGLFLLFYCIIAVVALIAGFVLTQFPEQIFGSKFTNEEIILAQKLMYFLAVGVALSFVNSVFSMFINANEKFIYQNVLGIVGAVVNPLVTLPLLILGYGAVSLTVVSVGVNFVLFFVNIHYARRLGFSFTFKSLEPAVFKEVFTFSFFILITSVAGQINSTVDKFLLARFIGSSAVSVYEIGSRFNSYLMSFSLTVSNVFIPRVNMLVAEKKSDSELTSLMTRVGRIQFYIMWLIFFGFVLVGRYFIGVYAGEGYFQSYTIALLLMGASIIPYCQNIGIEIQKAKNRHMFRAVAYFIIALGNIAVSIPLIGKLGISGAALGSALALLVGNVVIMNIYYKYGVGLDMAYFWRGMLRPAIAALTASVPFFVLTRFWQVDRMSRFLTVSIAFTAFYVLCVLFIGFNDYEKKLLADMLEKLKSIKNKLQSGKQ